MNTNNSRWFHASKPHLKTQSGPAVGLAVALFATSLALAADNAEADKLLTAARDKETHAQELRAAAAAASQKAADDEMEATAEERQARIFSARALEMMKADVNKQKAFQLRQESRQLLAEANRKEIEQRNAISRVAQLQHNAEELQKAAAQIHDQPAVAETLANDAKAAEAAAQRETQVAAAAGNEAGPLYRKAVEAWKEAEKLDPETHQKVAAPQAKPIVVPKREVK